MQYLRVGAIGIVVLTAAVAADAAELRADKVDFNRQIRPLLSDKCFRCHGPDAHKRQADLRLDTAAGATADLGGRQAIVSGKADESELVARITSTDAAERMPPPDSGKTLSPEQIALLQQWVNEGAEYQAHWSFIPPRPASAPPVQRGDWPKNDIDRFILSRLEREKIAPSPEADRVTLIRRLSFDLIGLPPTSAEVDAFVADADPQAYEKVVDRLLESKHFGERMAMYWLDLVRYADTVGYHGDQEHPITPYRDWVIKAFNDNLPFDRFTIEQLAGDLLPDATIDQKIASGYNRLLQTSHEGGVQVKEYLHKYDADRVRNLGAVWMGATLGCVECHDHKYDPYAQRDYYRLVAVFADVDDTRTFKGGDTNPTKREPEMVVLSPLVRERIEELEARVAAIEKREAKDAADGGARPEEKSPLPPSRGEGRGGGGEWPNDVQRGAGGARPASESSATRRPHPNPLPAGKGEMGELRREIDELKKQTRRTMVTEAIAPKTVRVLARGDWQDETGDVVEPGIPEFLGKLEVEGRRLTRLDLARWLVSPEHPQTSRVFVNRLWSLFFGTGLSDSLEDSGSQGESPSHPELLDWLAVEFSTAWDVKRTVRLIVTSATYRQASQARPELSDRDPKNRLYARQTAFRLPAEIVRDNALAISGLLLDRVGGDSGHPYQPAGYYKHLNFPKREYQADTDEKQYRRGVYVHWQRQYLHPMLRAFDAPSREECTARRSISNTPLSALVLLNDPTFVEAARVFAARIIRQGGATDTERIHWAWRIALSREPAKDEAAPIFRLLESSRETYRTAPDEAKKLLAVGLAPQPDGIDATELAAWTTIARALFNLHETITRN